MKAAFLKQLTGHGSGIYCLTKSGIDNHFYSGSADGMVGLWNTESSVPSPFSVRVGSAVLSVSSLPQRAQLLIGQYQGHLHIVDLQARTELRNLHYLSKGVFRCIPVAGGEFLAACGGDGNLAIIDSNTFELKLLLSLSQNKLRALAETPDGKHILVGGSDGMLRLLDTTYFNELAAYDVHDGGVYALAWLSPNKLVTGGRDGHLRFWEFSGLQLLQYDAIPAHNFAIYDIALHPSGRYFATASRDKTAKIWDLQNLRQPLRLSRQGLQGHSHSVNAVLWMGDTLATTGDDKQIILWQFSPTASP